MGADSVIAAVDLSAGVAIGFEHNSNAIDRTDLLSTPGSGNLNQSDSAMRLTGTVAAKSGVEGPWHWGLDGRFIRSNFDRFDALDYNEYAYGGNVDWRAGEIFDLSIQGSQNRAPIELADVGGEEVRLQTTSNASGTFHVRPTPRWQLGFTPSWMQAELSLPYAIGFELHESSGTGSLEFLGAGRLVPGVALKKLHGRYSGIADATRYEEESLQGTLNYKVTDFSSFSLSAGRTERSTRLIDPSNNPLALSLEGSKPAFTGSLSYQRQLSVKTGVTLSAFRDFQQYDAGVNTRVATGVSASALWTPTSRLTASAQAQYVSSTINGLSLINGVLVAGTIDGRKDKDGTYTVDVKYLATPRVGVRSYVAYRVRNSSIQAAAFNGTTIGLELGAFID